MIDTETNIIEFFERVAMEGLDYESNPTMRGVLFRVAPSEFGHKRYNKIAYPFSVFFEPVLDQDQWFFVLWIRCRFQKVVFHDVQQLIADLREFTPKDIGVEFEPDGFRCQFDGDGREAGDKSCFERAPDEFEKIVSLTKRLVAIGDHNFDW